MKRVLDHPCRLCGSHLVTMSHRPYGGSCLKYLDDKKKWRSLVFSDLLRVCCPPTSVGAALESLTLFRRADGTKAQIDVCKISVW